MARVESRWSPTWARRACVDRVGDVDLLKVDGVSLTTVELLV